MPKVSDIMAICNTKKEWLCKAIENINQIYGSFGLIIVDAGSANNVKGVITLYSNERIRYKYQVNQTVKEDLKLAEKEKTLRDSGYEVLIPQEV